MAIEAHLRKSLIAAIRPAGDRSLREVVAASGVSLATLSDFIHGRGSLRINQVERLAAELGFNVLLERKAKR